MTEEARLGDEDIKDRSKRQLWSKLDALYKEDPELPSSFAGVEELYRAARGIQGASRKAVREYLSSQPSYSKFKQRRRRFKRRAFVAFDINEVWSADLVDYSTVSRQNGGNRFILLATDHLSGMIYLRAQKT